MLSMGLRHEPVLSVRQLHHVVADRSFLGCEHAAILSASSAGMPYRRQLSHSPLREPSSLLRRVHRPQLLQARSSDRA